MDASFLSFVAIVLVVLIIIIVLPLLSSSCAHGSRMRRRTTRTLTSTPPIQDNQDVGNEEDPLPREPEREEMTIEKTGTASYTVSNVYEDDKLKIKLTPGGSSVA